MRLATSPMLVANSAGKVPAFKIPYLVPGTFSIVEIQPLDAKQVTSVKGVNILTVKTLDSEREGTDSYFLAHNYPDPDKLRAFVENLQEEDKDILLCGVKNQPIQFDNLTSMVVNADWLYRNHDEDLDDYSMPAAAIKQWFEQGAQPSNCSPSSLLEGRVSQVEKNLDQLTSTQLRPEDLSNRYRGRIMLPWIKVPGANNFSMLPVDKRHYLIKHEPTGNWHWLQKQEGEKYKAVPHMLTQETLDSLCIRHFPSAAEEKQADAVVSSLKPSIRQLRHELSFIDSAPTCAIGVPTWLPKPGEQVDWSQPGEPPLKGIIQQISGQAAKIIVTFVDRAPVVIPRAGLEELEEKLTGSRPELAIRRDGPSIGRLVAYQPKPKASREFGRIISEQGSKVVVEFKRSSSTYRRHLKPGDIKPVLELPPTDKRLAFNSPKCIEDYLPAHTNTKVLPTQLSTIPPNCACLSISETKDHRIATFLSYSVDDTVLTEAVFGPAGSEWEKLAMEVDVQVKSPTELAKWFDTKTSKPALLISGDHATLRQLRQNLIEDRELQTAAMKSLERVDIETPAVDIALS